MHEGIVSKETEFADNPSTWFGHLKRDGVHALRMVYRSTDGQTFGDKTITDRMLVGFAGGGGSWLMEAISPSGSDFWEGRWEVGDRERKDQRIWRVKYGRVATNRPTVHRPTTDISALKNKLADNLESIGSFARVQNLNAFAKAFGGGLANLRSQDPCNGVHHSDLSPELRPGGSYGNT